MRLVEREDAPAQLITRANAQLGGQLGGKEGARLGKRKNAWDRFWAKVDRVITGGRLGEVEH